MRLPEPFGSGFRTPAARWAVFLLGVAFTALGIFQTIELFIQNPAYPQYTDLNLYMRAGGYAVSGVNPYSTEANPGFDIYGYPPLLADVVGLMELTIGRMATCIVWPILCVGSLAGAIVLLSRGFGYKIGWHWIMLIIGIVSLGRIGRMDIYHGQVNVIILMMLLAGLIWHGRGRTVLAATCLAICMSLKPFFGVLVFYFLVRREWRMAIWSLVMGAVVFFLSFLPLAGQSLESFFGWREASTYLISGDSGARGDNQSMYGMFIRMFSETKFSSPWINVPILVPIFTGLSVGFVATVGWFGFGSRKASVSSLAHDRSAVRMIECMAVMALSLACGPYAEGDHIFFTLAAAAAAIFLGMERIDAGTPHKRLWIAMALSWLVLVFFLVLPIKVWLTLGTYDTWVDLSGWTILLSGRNGFLLMLAGSLTAVTLGLERRAKQQAVAEGLAGSSRLPTRFPLA